ncbi:MAG: TolC family protein [Myxococcales bacterium]|nr:TolC family protein [Myxococcales bacterium]
MRPALLALVLLAPACFRAPAPSGQRSLATWHAMRDTTPPGARANAGGAPSPAPGEALTAEQAYRLALARNPDLAIAEAEADVAEAQIGEAKQLENPTLRFTNFQVDETVGRPGFNLGLRAPIPRPGSRHARIQAAKMVAGGARARAEAARRLLHAEVQRLFARLALLTADLEELARAAELAERRRQQIAARVDRAVATRVDLSLATVDHAEIVDEVSRVRSEKAATESEITALVAPGTRQTYRVGPADLEPSALAGDRDALIERAVAARPEPRAGQSSTGAAEAELYLARNEVWPWLTWAQVNYAINPTAMTATSQNAFGFALALDLPLLSWNRGKIRAARALVRQRNLEERAAVATVAAEVDAALARVREADRRLQDLDANLLPQVEDAARQADEALAAGGLDLEAVLEIHERRIAARRLRLAALYERRDAVLALEAAISAAP